MAWKAFLSALSVDDNVRKLEIHIVSRCNCCEVGAYEDLNHVLEKGDFSKAIWEKVFNYLGLISMRGRGWCDRVEGWF